MEAYMNPDWTLETVTDDLGSWLMPIDWLTVAATVLIVVGTTIASENA